MQSKTDGFPKYRLLSDTPEGICWFDCEGNRVVRQEKVIYIQDAWIRSRRISPNHRWLWLALYADTVVIDLVSKKLHYLARSQRLEDGSYTLAVHHCFAWSPSSNQSLSLNEGDLLLFSPPKQGYRQLAKGVYWAGWYPDSKSVWFVRKVDLKAMNQSEQRLKTPHYRIDLRSGKPFRVPLSGVRQLVSNWDFLAFGWRKGIGDLFSDYLYTLDRSLRIGYSLEGNPTVIQVERRDRTRTHLRAPFQSRLAVCPQDISHDKRYILMISGDTWEIWGVDLVTYEWVMLLDHSKEFPNCTLLGVFFERSGYLIGL